MDISESKFEKDIEHYMLNTNGYIKGDQKTYSRERAIDLTKLISFIKKTQEDKWKRFGKKYGADSEDKLYKKFQESVEREGLIYVLRHGIKDEDITLKIVAFKAETGFNQKVIDNYNANILECTRQFKYSTENENSIDIVLSINGIPLVALELKNQMTGQNVNNAKRQYMEDRNPKELCFHFDTRFLVYFAVDTREIAMTTALKGKDTFFLPFNQGSNGAGHVGGAGNPDCYNGYITAYLWENILKKDTLLEIIQRYIHVEKQDNRKTLIFPRYHQLDVVSKLINKVKEVGTGNNYLIQHSAGSGKSNSIAWLAYGLSNLHDKNNEKIFNSIIVVTDRTVLDSQLQDTIYSFDHTQGVVKKIDGSSKDLKDAINNGKKIIITTLQKFPFIYQDINDNTNKRFAIIVDEAHSSQSGNSARKLKQALADTEQALKEFAEVEEIEESELKDGEDFIVSEMLSHGKQKNLSFFAFTATPKQKTLEMFGERQLDGTFKPFHIYSMKQAIEEGFILDVLKNYRTYKTYFNIVKSIPDNPYLPKSKATKAIKNYSTLVELNIKEKTAIIIDYFREVTKNKIGGRAKAMLVTASRAQAVRYYHEFKSYINSDYDDIDILIAFSGSVKVNDIEYTEEGLNKRKDGSHIKEKQLPEEFHTNDYSMLIVADKYQTGFDEPLLHTMFVDKKLSGVKAVQTLSRLNRTCKGKVDTSVLDFVNTAQEIQDAFKPYFESTILDEAIDPNEIYKIQDNIKKYNLYDRDSIDKFLKKLFTKEPQTENDLGILTSIFNPIVNKYLKLNEEQRYEYKGYIKNFNKWYSYISQIVKLYDKELQKEYHFTYYLEKFLPNVYDNKEDVDLNDKLKLEFFSLKEEFSGSISLNPDYEDTVLINTKSLDPQIKKEEEKETLDILIEKINEKFKGDFTEDDRVIIDALYKKCKNNVKLKEQALNNNEETYKSIFTKTFYNILYECIDESKEYEKNMDRLGKDKNILGDFMQEIAKLTYREFRE